MFTTGAPTLDFSETLERHTHHCKERCSAMHHNIQRQLRGKDVDKFPTSFWRGGGALLGVSLRGVSLFVSRMLLPSFGFFFPPIFLGGGGGLKPPKPPPFLRLKGKAFPLSPKHWCVV